MSFWDCKYSEYEEYWDGEEEGRVYMCHHPNGVGYCPLFNKHGTKEDCKLLDNKEIK